MFSDNREECKVEKSPIFLFEINLHFILENEHSFSLWGYIIEESSISLFKELQSSKKK